MELVKREALSDSVDTYEGESYQYQHMSFMFVFIGQSLFLQKKTLPRKQKYLSTPKAERRFDTPYSFGFLKKPFQFFRPLTCPSGMASS